MSHRPDKNVFRDAVSVLGLWVPYAFLVHRFWYVNDDAFITFRYAQNWARGYGLRYNLGAHPPVEGYSNFLWVVVSALLEYLELDVTLWMPFLSFVAGLGFIALLYYTLLHRFQLDWAVAFLSVSTLACFPPFAVWSTSGLETMPFALALFVAFERLALRRSGPAPLAAGLAGLAVALLRIEGIAWAILVGLIGCFARWGMGTRRFRPFAIYVAMVVGGFLIYFVGRYLYFEALWPNPVYVKVRFGPEVLLRGYRYAATYYLTFLTPFLILPSLLVTLLGKDRRWNAAGIAVAMMAIAVPVYAIVVGGDWMTMGRFFIPGLAFQTVLLAWLVQAVWTKWPVLRSLTVVAVVIAIGVALLPAWNIHLVSPSVRRQLYFMYGHGYYTEYERWVRQSERPMDWKEEGLTLRRMAKPGDSVVVGAIGAIGYYSGLYIYDRFGLVNSKVAMEAADHRDLRSPGHDHKVSRDFFLSKEYPTFIIHAVLQGNRLRDKVIGTAETWRRFQSRTLWRRYAPELAVIGDKPISKADRVLMVLRLIEEDTDDPVRELPRPRRKRVRGKRASALWNNFYEKAKKLPNH